MLDRKTPPPYSSQLAIKLPHLDSRRHHNGLDIHYLNNPHLDIFRLELVFEAGTYFGDGIGDSYFAAKMMTSGTQTKNSVQLMEAFDKYGGFLEVAQNQERLQVVLHGLHQYFDAYMPPLVELVNESVFLEEEFDIQQKISLQSFLVNKEKTAVECGMIFKTILYGEDNSFGQSLDEAVIGQANRTQVFEFYKNNIQNRQFDVFLCGKINEDNLASFENHFSKSFRPRLKRPIVSPAMLSSQNVYVEKEEAMQTSIRMGKRLFNRTHPDFYKFMVFNTLLGGYFGSRLMKNIREEKGFTYGISSSLIPLCGESYWVIGSDVKKENADQTIEEIYKEINTLKNQTVNTTELLLVKNHITGSILGQTNTVFDIMDKRKAVKFEDLSPDFYDHLITNIQKIQPADIIEMAQKYMTDLSVARVG
jgi:zinc protease